MNGTLTEDNAVLVATPTAVEPSRQAYRILCFAFIVAPIVAGADKFFGLLASWEAYLAPAFADLLPFSATTFMRVVGVVEIVAGALVALRPRLGAWVVAGWLLAIILNLLVRGGALDIALRDLGLCLAAIALARLSVIHDHHGTR